MKIVGRVVYAFVMVIFFLFTYNYARQLMTSLYFEEEGSNVLDEDEVDYTFFYGSVPNYFLSEALYTVMMDGYEINLFEIAKVESTIGTPQTQSYYYLTLHSKSHEMNGNYQLMFVSPDNEVQPHIVDVVQFRTLNLYVGINDQQAIYLDPVFLNTHTIDQIILQKDLETIASIEGLSLELSTHIDQKITSFYQEEGRLPVNDELAMENIYPYQTHVMDDYTYVFVIAMGIYFLILSVATYFTYFFKRGRKDKKTELLSVMDGKSS